MARRGRENRYRPEPRHGGGPRGGYGPAVTSPASTGRRFGPGGEFEIDGAAPRRQYGRGDGDGYGDGGGYGGGCGGPWARRRPARRPGPPTGPPPKAGARAAYRAPPPGAGGWAASADAPWAPPGARGGPGRPQRSPGDDAAAGAPAARRRPAPAAAAAVPGATFGSRCTTSRRRYSLVVRASENRGDASVKVRPGSAAASEGDEFVLLCAKKRAKCKTSNYVISTARAELRHGRDSKQCVGKLRANVERAEYVCFDSGANPRESAGGGRGSRAAGGRAARGAVTFQANQISRAGRA